MLCAGLSTAEVEQTAQLSVDLVVIVPRDHFWHSVVIETKNSNVSMIDVNTLNKTCGVSDSTSCKSLLPSNISSTILNAPRSVSVLLLVEWCLHIEWVCVHIGLFRH